MFWFFVYICIDCECSFFPFKFNFSKSFHADMYCALNTYIILYYHALTLSHVLLLATFVLEMFYYLVYFFPCKYERRYY